MSSAKPMRRTLGPVAYQHITNGGLSFQTIRTEYERDDGSPLTQMDLEVRQSSMGVSVAFKLPLFKTTAAILRDVADRIDSASDIDPVYLQPIDATLETADGENISEWRAISRASHVSHATKSVDIESSATVEDLVDGVADLGSYLTEKLSGDHATPVKQQTLEELIEQHRIAVFPEFESSVWNAEVYDEDSATPTRAGMGRTPLEAVQFALKKAIPEHGDTLDTINQHAHLYGEGDSEQTRAPQ